MADLAGSIQKPDTSVCSPGASAALAAERSDMLRPGQFRGTSLLVSGTTAEAKLYAVMQELLTVLPLQPVCGCIYRARAG